MKIDFTKGLTPENVNLRLSVLYVLHEAGLHDEGTLTYDEISSQIKELVEFRRPIGLHCKTEGEEGATLNMPLIIR